MARPYPGKIIKLGSYGDDVLYIKKHLFSLGYYDDSVKKVSSNVFGSDSVKATNNFQTKYPECGTNGKPDGEIGKKTWDKIEKLYDAKHKYITYLEKKYFPNLSDTTIKLLNDAWQGSSSDRIRFMKYCVIEAYDAAHGTYNKGDHLVGMYIIGANLYNKSGSVKIPTASYIKSVAKTHPTYFSGGREAFMLKELAYNPSIHASDCSGMIIGVGWMTKLYTGSDATADSLSTRSSFSTNVAKDNMVPGDWVAKSGHIGVYIGAGLVVEFAGGAYGCQITELNNRRCRNMMTGKLEKMSAWTRFRKPKWY